MIIKKIISGGQTGVDRAALDIAIKFNIEHGGWIPKGRKAEDGILPLKYQLVQMDTADYKERTKQNIIDADGTAIIYRGKLTGGSLLTMNFAKIIKKQYYIIDLLRAEEFEAAIMLKTFIQENKIQILNIAGPRQSHEPAIYTDTKVILETMFYLLFLDTNQDQIIKDYIPSAPVKEDFPQTLKHAVALICDDLSLKTRIFIARIKKKQIYLLYFAMLEYLRHRVGFDLKNEILLKNCSLKMQNQTCTIEDAVMEILKQLKQYLERDHKLRIVK